RSYRRALRHDAGRCVATPQDARRREIRSRPSRGPEAAVSAEPRGFCRDRCVVGSVPPHLGIEVRFPAPTLGGQEMTNANIEDEEGLVIHEHFDASIEELWELISDPDELSAWVGGRCTIDPRVGGDIRFELPDDGVVATGVIR